MARDDARAGDESGGEVRDFARQGDVGEAGHSAFGQDKGHEHRHNDERLAGRGRNPGREDGTFLDEPAEEGADEARGAGPGVVRGLTPPRRDEVGG